MKLIYGAGSVCPDLLRKDITFKDGILYVEGNGGRLMGGVLWGSTTNPISQIALARHILKHYGYTVRKAK